MEAAHGFRGVSYVPKRGWMANKQAIVNGKRVTLYNGQNHATAEEAAHAYDILVYLLHGDEAHFNLPDRMTPEVRARLDGYADVHEYLAERKAVADKEVDARARQGTSKFRGVSKKKGRAKPFLCRYYLIPGQPRVEIFFADEEEAAHAYDRAQLEIHGRAAIARLNFPLASYQAAGEFSEEQLDEIDARVAAGKPPPASGTVTAAKPAARRRGGGTAARKRSDDAGASGSGGGAAAAAAAAAAAEEEDEEEDEEWDDAGYWSSESLEELEAGGVDPPQRGSKVSPYKAYAGMRAAATGDAGSALLAAFGGFESGDEPDEITEEELAYGEEMRETARQLGVFDDLEKMREEFRQFRVRDAAQAQADYEAAKGTDREEHTKLFAEEMASDLARVEELMPDELTLMHKLLRRDLEEQAEFNRALLKRLPLGAHILMDNTPLWHADGSHNWFSIHNQLLHLEADLPSMLDRICGEEARHRYIRCLRMVFECFADRDWDVLTPATPVEAAMLREIFERTLPNTLAGIRTGETEDEEEESEEDEEESEGDAEMPTPAPAQQRQQGGARRVPCRYQEEREGLASDSEDDGSEGDPMAGEGDVLEGLSEQPTKVVEGLSQQPVKVCLYQDDYSLEDAQTMLSDIADTAYGPPDAAAAASVRFYSSLDAAAAAGSAAAGSKAAGVPAAGEASTAAASPSGSAGAAAAAAPSGSAGAAGGDIRLVASHYKGLLERMMARKQRSVLDAYDVACASGGDTRQVGIDLLPEPHATEAAESFGRADQAAIESQKLEMQLRVLQLQRTINQRTHDIDMRFKRRTYDVMCTYWEGLAVAHYLAGRIDWLEEHLGPDWEQRMQAAQEGGPPIFGTHNAPCSWVPVLPGIAQIEAEMTGAVHTTPMKEGIAAELGLAGLEGLGGLQWGECSMPVMDQATIGNWFTAVKEQVAAGVQPTGLLHAERWAQEAKKGAWPKAGPRLMQKIVNKALGDSKNSYFPFDDDAYQLPSPRARRAAQQAARQAAQEQQAQGEQQQQQQPEMEAERQVGSGDAHMAGAEKE